MCLLQSAGERCIFARESSAEHTQTSLKPSRTMMNLEVPGDLSKVGGGGEDRREGRRWLGGGVGVGIGFRSLSTHTNDWYLNAYFRR